MSEWYTCDVCGCLLCVFFFKQKTAYEMRISDWSSDVCSSDLNAVDRAFFDRDVDAVDRQRAVEPLYQPARLDGQGARARGIACLRGKIGRASCRERVGQYV